MDLARAGLRAIEGRPAAESPFLLDKDLQALPRCLVAAIVDEAVGVDDRRRAEVLLFRPERRAGSGAGRAPLVRYPICWQPFIGRLLS